MADAANQPARDLLAQAYERQGRAAESAIWRNMYLTGARELRSGVRPTRASPGAGDLVRSTPTGMLLDLLSVRLDPAKSQGRAVRVDLVFPDRKERFRVLVRNDVLTWEKDPRPGRVDGTFTLPRTELLGMALAGQPGHPVAEGDPTALRRLLGYLSAPKADFPIVTR